MSGRRWNLSRGLTPGKRSVFRERGEARVWGAEGSEWCEGGRGEGPGLRDGGVDLGL